MIEVKDLTKVYKSRRGGSCVALDHVSFSLPDKGFVFIIGKSGSGKSTLLNMLGCLDTITSGDIVANGRSFAKLKLSEQTYYRNSTIGFIFQDFHLLDNLNIFDNIMLSLQLQGEKDKEKVLKSLKDTGLEEYARRYPKELSGGQKQRVAIARALVKNPSILLADEPTGNLDSKTTIQILDLLKELSKEKLVIIVSHNLSNAHTYADEIIELAEGKILQHLKRNQDFDCRLRVEDDTLIIPSEQTFSEENIQAISAAMESGNVRKIKQDKGQFSPSEEVENAPAPQPTKFEKKHLKFKDTTVLAWKFARRSWVKMALYSLIVAVLMTVLGLSQLVMNFNGAEVVANEMAKRNLSCNSFLKNENESYESLDALHLVDIENGDIQSFYDAGYDGKIYPLINNAYLIKKGNVGVHHEKFILKSNPFEIDSTIGMLVTEESYLEKIFGKLEYVLVDKNPKDYGYYITDFTADVCLISRSDKVKTYQELLGKATNFTVHSYGYVNGIIDTGYKERYADVISKLTNPQMSKKDINEYAKTDECLAFYDEICQYLNITYSFNPDIIEDVVKAANREFVAINQGLFEYNGQNYEPSITYFSKDSIRNSVKLNDNEAIFNFDEYNRTFGTSFSLQNVNEFVPHDVKFTYYFACDENRTQIKYETTLKIVGLKSAEYSNVATNVLQELQRIQMFTFGLYFDNDEQMPLVMDVANQNGFLPNSAVASSISTMAQVVQVFSKFFNLIFTVLCVCIFALLVQFSVKNIKDKIKEIGIMKALGGREGDLMRIFGFQTIVVGLLMMALYVCSSFLFVQFANNLLAVSLVKLATNAVVMDLSFLTVKWKYILQNCLLAFGIIVVSFVIPMLMLRAIKPTKVIKANE